MTDSKTSTTGPDMSKTTAHTAGEWGVACDSYGKVRHSRKACIYTTVVGPDGERLVHIASRIPNWDDAHVMAAGKKLLSALKALNHMGGDERGGFCICPRRDGSAPDHEHATTCADARAAISRAEAENRSSSVKNDPAEAAHG